MTDNRPKSRILIADSDEIGRESLCEILGEHYSVLEAVDGSEVLSKLRTDNAISLVILDLSLPVMNGYRVLEEIKRDSRLCQIPIVVIAAGDSIEEQICALDCDAAGVINRPFHTGLLQHKIANVIRRTEASRFSEKARLYRQWLREAETDPKTGLYNKAAFCRHAAEVLRQNPEKSYVILRWDVDHFKMFNDIYGMSEGDKLLAETGRYYREVAGQLGKIEVYGRWDADHFITLREKGSFREEDILHIFNERLQGRYPEFEFIVRIGIYEVTDPSIDVALMCDRAMLAMHTVKNNYSTHWAWYSDSMRLHMIEEQELSSEMKAALAAEQFTIYFQPQFNYNDRTLYGAEALVRWPHPRKGMIPPGKFIPLCERSGFICELDQYVWRKTCMCLRRWLDEGRKVVPVAVNVSRNDIYNPHLCDIFQDLLTEFRLPSSLLRLEITESAYMECPEQLIRAVQQLQNSGFQVEMDDFGSGYSSLNTLKDVPVDVLKLDMKFVAQSEEDTRGGNILSAVVGMAHSLRLPVIAEGVETQRQADFLGRIGCRYMQGYLFAMPMPIPSFEKLLSRFAYFEGKKNTLK